MGDFAPQRVVSLQPSVTSTLDRLGLIDRVVACTKWCVDVVPALRNEPRLIVADSWSAKSAEILAAKPDMVMASVPYQLDAVAEILKAGIPFMGFAPRTLHHVFRDIGQIAAVMGVATPLFAALSDRTGRRRVCLGAAVLAIVWAFPLFALVNTGNPVLIAIGMSVGMISFAALFAPMGAFLPELFATRYRYTGSSVAYNASSIVGGGLSPILATQMIASTGSSVPISAYLVLIALICAVCVWFMRETHTADLTSDPADSRP